MTGRISGNRPIPQGSEYTEETGVTLRPTRSTEGAQRSSGTAGPAQGTAAAPWDQFLASQASPAPTVGQAAVAARQAEIRGRATELLERARREPAGQTITIPAARTGNFRQFVDRQHDRALNEGGIETAAAIVATFGGAEVARRGGRATEAAVAQAERGEFAAAVETLHHAHSTHLRSIPIATAIAELPHIAHMVAHPDAETFGSLVLGAAAHVSGELVNQLPGGALAAGVVSTLRNASRVLTDGDARRDYQQSASVEDARRAEAMRASSAARNFGEQDARFAAAGRTEINWALYRESGDYAAGVNRGLRQATQDPAGVAHLALGNPIAMRRDLSGN
jgi:hypothetical protein